MFVVYLDVSAVQVFARFPIVDLSLPWVPRVASVVFRQHHDYVAVGDSEFFDDLIYVHRVHSVSIVKIEFR